MSDMSTSDNETVLSSPSHPSSPKLTSSKKQEELLGLWEQAYENLQVSNSDLIGRYEQAISRYYASNPDVDVGTPLRRPSTIVDNGKSKSNQANVLARRSRMNQLLGTWLRDDQSGNQGVLSFKDIVRSTALDASGGDDALVWVAACFAAKSTLETSTSTSGSISRQHLTLIHIISSLQWYSAFQEFLVEHRPNDKKRRVNILALKAALTDFYETILSCLIQMACSEHKEEERLERPMEDSWQRAIREKEQSLAESFGDNGMDARLREIYDNGEAPTDEGDEEKATADTLSTTVMKDFLNALEEFDVHDVTTDEHGSTEVVQQAYNAAESVKEFRLWAQKNEDRVLCISGAPGAGKSLLLAAIAKHMRSNTGQSDTETDTVCTAHFSFGSGKSDSENGKMAVYSLILQLVKHQQPLVTHLEGWLRRTRKEILGKATGLSAVSRVLCTMLEASSCPATYFVLDAIDGCCVPGNEAESRHMLDGLLSLVSSTLTLSPKAKWLISVDSRNPAAVLDPLSADSRHPLHVNLDESPDILLPVAHALADYRTLQLTNGPGYEEGFRATIAKELLHRSQGNLLWLNLASKVIRSRGSPWAALHILADLPVGVETLYSYAQQALENLSFEDPVYCRNLLFTAAAAYRPLSIYELQDLTELATNVDLKLLIETRCSCFLRIHDDRVYFVHKSAKDFIRKGIESEHGLHIKIIKRCLVLLSTRVGQGMTKETTDWTYYATSHWLSHLCEVVRDGGSIDNAMTTMVVRFFKEEFISWVGASRQSSDLSRTLIQVIMLEKTLRRSHDCTSEYLPLAKFGIRYLQVLLTTKLPQEVTPDNALLFCPGEGTLRNEILESRYPWLSFVPPADPNTAHTLSGHWDWVRHCAYSPDGHLLVSGSDDRTVRLWEPLTGEGQTILHGFNAWVRKVLISATGYLVTMEDHRIKVWNTATLTNPKVIETAAFRPETQDRAVEQVDKDDQSSSSSDNDDSPVFINIACSLDGKRLAAVMSELCVVWSLPSLEQLTKIKTDRGDSHMPLVFSGDGHLARGTGSTVTIWNSNEMAAAPQSIDIREENGGDISSLSFSSDSRMIAVGTDNGRVLSWEIDPKEPVIKRFSDHDERVIAVYFPPDGTSIASAAIGGMLAIRHLDTENSAQRKLSILPGGLLSVAFSPTGEYLAGSGYDGTIRVVEIDNDSENNAVAAAAERPQLHTEFIRLVRISPSGKLVASASSNGLICVWSGETGALDKSLNGHEGRIICLAFSDNGIYLASGSTDEVVRVWNTGTGLLTHILEGHNDWIRSVAFSPSAALLASASDDKSIRIWDISKSHTSPEQIQKTGPASAPFTTLQGHSDYVYSVTFSPDGQLLASGGDDYKIILWDSPSQVDGDSASAEPLQPRKAFDARECAIGIVFHPDGKRIISSSVFDKISVWNIETESRLRTIDCARSSFLQINREYPDWISTAHGAVYLPQEPVTDSEAMELDQLSTEPRPWWTSWSLAKDGWISWKDRRALYVPEHSASHVLGNRIAVGFGSGHVMLFKFEEDTNPFAGDSL